MQQLCTISSNYIHATKLITSFIIADWRIPGTSGMAQKQSFEGNGQDQVLAATIHRHYVVSAHVDQIHHRQ